MIFLTSLGIKINHCNFPHAPLGKLTQKKYRAAVTKNTINAIDSQFQKRGSLYVVWVTTCWVNQNLNQYYTITRHKLLLYPVMSSSRDLVSVSFWYVYNFFNPLTTNVPLIQKPVNWFALQINWLVSTWEGHWSLKV